MNVLLVAPCPPPYGGMALQAALLTQVLDRDGVAVVPFPSNPSFPIGLKWVQSIPALRTAIRFLLFLVRLWRQVPKTDVVHVFAASWLYFFAVAAPAVLVSRTCGKRTVLTYHGGDAPAFFRKFGLFVRPIFRFPAVVTAPSEFLGDLIRRRLGRAVSIIPNLLDTSAFRYRQRASFAPRLLVNRHLEKIYDVEAVLKAFRIIQNHRPEATLSVAGTGSQEESLREFAAANALRNVKFLGAVPHDEMPALYDQCDILVNASGIDNFPGALLEASSAGLAVVSTGAGGIPAIYRNGETALLVQPGDWRALAASVEKVLRNPVRAAGMTRAAARVVRSCEWPAVRPLLYAAYGIASSADSREHVALPVSTRH